MAWRPWYEEVADMNSASDRSDYIRSVFAPGFNSGGGSGGGAGVPFAISFGFGWMAGRALMKRLRGRKRAGQEAEAQQMSAPVVVAPAGWYPDPMGAGHRYWNGQAWTDRITN